VLRPGEANDHARQREMTAAGLLGGAGVPAVSSAGTIAVVEVLFREPYEPTTQGMTTLRACGVLVGEFLSHRRGELETTTLTKREIEILQLASDGLTGPKIAAHLVISPATVKSHFEHIYPKLGVSDRSNAVAEALRLGLIR
jgi:ATP/maltotriose-dependent transcriptional regulator MalT